MRSMRHTRGSAPAAHPSIPSCSLLSCRLSRHAAPSLSSPALQPLFLTARPPQTLRFLHPTTKGARFRHDATRAITRPLAARAQAKC
mmetsp:Transcript_2151/g.4819  ORF Transcript_2151/g.4819 Transcript_2151/m.4819 type:complete len:87 (+) Transcript_2151:460-720(+)